MSDRSVVVKLRAEIGQFKSAMAEAGKATAAVGGAAILGNANTSKAIKGQKADWDALGNKATLVGGAMVLGMGLAVKSVMDFDKQMSSVQAATHASAQEMDSLRNAAVEAGASTVYTAAESAAAIENLSKAGVSAADILGGGLDGALALASAGSLDVASAAEIAATTITQFGLKGTDMAHVADLLAAGAGKAQGDVQDLALALEYVGITASQMGVSVEQTTGTLALLASNGQLGEKAGTGLRGVLASLTAPSQLAKQTMDNLGISLYDAGGKFVGVSGMAEQLKTKLAPLDEATRNAALGQIFGNAQIETARILYQGGAAAVDEWTAKVNDQGYAAETASLKLDNLSGDLEKLHGALDSQMIKSGGGFTSTLRGATQGLTGLIDAADNIPAPLIVGTTALIGLAGAALVAAPRVAAVKTTFDALGPSGQRAAKGVALGTGAVIAFTAALTVLSATTGPDDINVDGMTKSLNEFATTGKMSGDAANIIGEDFSQLQTRLSFMLTPNWYENATKGVGQISAAFGQYSTEGDVSKEILSIDTALSKMQDRGAAAGIFSRITEEASKTGITVEQLAGLFPAYTASVSATTAPTTTAASALEVLGDAASSAEAKVNALNTMLAAGSAKDAAITAWRSMAASIKENDRALMGNLDKAIANRDAVRQWLSAAQTAGEDAGHAMIRFGNTMNMPRRKLIEFANKLDGTGQLAQSIRNVSIEVTAPGAPKAATDIGKVWANAGKVPRNVAAKVAAPGAVTSNAQVVKVVGNLGRVIGKSARIAVPGALESQHSVASVVGQLNQVYDRSATISITTIARTIGAGIKPRAAGGPVTRGLPYLVGEQGPELYVPGSGGMIVPHAKTMTYLRDGGMIAGGYAGGTKKQPHLSAAQKKRQDATNQRRDNWAQEQTSVRDSYLRNWSFDFNANVNAISDLVQAQKDSAEAVKSQAASADDLFEARRKVNQASKADRPDALKALADAQTKYADSVAATAEAKKKEADTNIKAAVTAPTASNIAAAFIAQKQKTAVFLNQLKALKNRGLSAAMVTDIMGRSLDEAQGITQALTEDPSLIGVFNQTQAEITSTATALGTVAASIKVPNAPQAAQYAPADFNHDGKVTVAERKKYKKLHPAHRASGGPVKAGQPYVVGESGWETFIPAQNGTILPHTTMTPVAASSSATQSFQASTPIQIVQDTRVMWEGFVDFHNRTGFTMRGGKAFK